jgi:hypothetical protein
MSAITVSGLVRDYGVTATPMLAPAAVLCVLTVAGLGLLRRRNLSLPA